MPTLGARAGDDATPQPRQLLQARVRRLLPWVIDSGDRRSRTARVRQPTDRLFRPRKQTADIESSVFDLPGIRWHGARRRHVDNLAGDGGKSPLEMLSRLYQQQPLPKRIDTQIGKNARIETLAPPAANDDIYPITTQSHNVSDGPGRRLAR